VTLKARVLAGFLVLLAGGLLVIADSVRRELRERYLEAVEETLNDTVHVLAALMEAKLEEGVLNPAVLDEVFREARSRRFAAQIFDYTKSRVALHAYATDAWGIVVFDSRGDATLGQDYSRWNDVYLTLRGEYGARATRTDPADPASILLHVAAPIRHQGEIVGVVTVIKPQDSVTPFVQAARSRMLTAGLYAALAFVALSVVLSLWVSRPLSNLSAYVRSLKERENLRPPRGGAREIRDLGDEFHALWQELRGKRYIEAYIQTLTHELKSPLSTIRGAAELLDEEMSDERRRAFHAAIQRETGRIDALILRMLELAALENRRELQQVEHIPVDELVGEVAESMGPCLEAAGVELRVAVEEGLTVRGERFLLRHALVNMLDNAVRYSRRGGAIQVSAARQHHQVRLAVADTGPGIPEFALERVFERFYALPGPADGAKGTGLGLAFVREAAALHGGRAEIANLPCGGAEAVILLPV